MVAEIQLQKQASQLQKFKSNGKIQDVSCGNPNLVARSKQLVAASVAESRKKLQKLRKQLQNL
jgi:hypothetical protein